MHTTAEQLASTNSPAYAAETVSSSEKQLIELLRQRAEITRRIGALKKMLNGIASLFGNAVLVDELLVTLDRKPPRRSGFTTACRQVLMESTVPLRTGQACRELQLRFPGMVEHHKDLNASVTTIFHRLVKYGQARCFLDHEGARVWQWTKQPEQPGARLAMAESHGFGSIPANTEGVGHTIDVVEPGGN